MDVEEKIVTFIRDEVLFRRKSTELTADTPLATGLVDSLGMATIVSFLEEEFGVQIENTDLVPANFRTARDIARLVEGKRRAVA